MIITYAIAALSAARSILTTSSRYIVHSNNSKHYPLEVLFKILILVLFNLNRVERPNEAPRLRMYVKYGISKNL